MCSLGEERFGGPNNNYIKEYFNGKDPSKPAYINASGTVFTADETKQGIIATFKQKLNYSLLEKTYLKCYLIVILICEILEEIKLLFF